MSKFLIDTEYCVILKALHETNSLREAAILLEMDAGHLTRKIQTLPDAERLVQKVGNKWVLTETGKRMALWVDEAINTQKELLEEKPVLRIACFTWLAEQMLIPGYSKLKNIAQNRYGWSINIAGGNLEQEIVSGRAEFAITCHSPNDPLIAHKKFHPDPWLIVVPEAWRKEVAKLKGAELTTYLHQKSFIRLSSTDPEHVLGFTPKKNSELLSDGVIGVRTAVVSGLGWSCLPSYSLTESLKSKKIISLDLASETKGDLSVWWLRSRKNSPEQVKMISRWVTELL